MGTQSFHAQHAPMGAHSSFTVGMFGAEGGMALEKGGPAESGVFVGYRSASGNVCCLPFFKDVSNDAVRYSASENGRQPGMVIFGETEVSREYHWATDRFLAPGVDFRIASPFFPIPDPAVAPAEALKFASCPATILTLTVENDSSEAWEGFFALENHRLWSALPADSGLKGFTSRGEMGFACRGDVRGFSDFNIERALGGRHTTPAFMLGPVAGIRFTVPAGQVRSVHLVLGYFVSGHASFNQPSAYEYTRHFVDLQDVLAYAVEHRPRYLEEAEARDRELDALPISDSRKFLLCHATRSYYGSTEWLTTSSGEPLWVVNEGEYLMMNTLDLTVDMMFFELRFNPWTVRNVLEQFVERYAYVDDVFAPENPRELFPGGLSFTHDMGVANHFSPPGFSSYECSGRDRLCFSYMTCEQLTNWILCAGVYTAKTGDSEFLERHRDLLVQCFESLLNRDHPEPTRRNGLMSFESSRTQGGGEITTYDSLDHSLGQARNNVYLGGKCWASYVALAELLSRLGEDDRAKEAEAAAQRCAATLEAAFDEDLGFVPAVLEGGNRSAIIPAAEALVYPWEMGLRDAVAVDGPYGGYLRMLRRHVRHVLKPGVCLYDDGAWKLSSSADNSWMSKICLNQYVVREILGIEYGGEDEADAAHVRWEVEGSEFFACSDQFASGKPIGSRYYPRIVTSILWWNGAEGRAGSPLTESVLAEM